MTDSVSGFIDLILRNLPDNESELRGTIKSSFGDISYELIGHSVENYYEKGMPIDEVCLVTQSVLGLILKHTDRSDSGRVLIESLSQAGKLFSQKIRHDIRKKINGIYVIVDPAATDGRSVHEVVKSALSGGVSIVQYRDKQNDRSVFLEQSYMIKELCENHEALFVVNDAVDVARLTAADFLHVGQSDLPVYEARKLLSNKQGIGRSNDGLTESAQSRDEGADYLAVGAVYATSTMGKSSRTPVGAETVTLVKEAVDLPVVAIGGINETNLGEVRSAGADSACIVSAITMADNPEAAAKKMVAIWNQS